MSTNCSFRVNTPTVSHETIDGEAVIINLDTGNYYSLTNAGSAIWNLIVACQSLNDICRSVSEAYDGDLNEIQTGVHELLSQLQAENLIVAMDSSNGLQGVPAESAGGKTEKILFQSPVLQKYTDMQELLLLDPVHDVDDMGWPRKPE